MNILLIAVLIVFGACAIVGFKKGFLKTAFSLVSWILVLVLCEFATPIVTDLVVEYTDVEVVVQTTVEDKLASALEEAAKNEGLSDLEASLPAEVKAMLLGEHESLADVLLESAVLDVSPLVNGIMGILGFVITVIVLRIIMVIIEGLLGIVTKLPLIGPMDKMLGLLCGVAKGIIWCWVILAVISVLALTGVNTEFATLISQSELLTWLQNNNLLLNLIVNLK